MDENIGAACHGPGLWLQTGRPAGEAARLNAILLLACFPSAASPEDLGPVSEVPSLSARGNSPHASLTQCPRQVGCTELVHVPDSERQTADEGN